MSTKDIRTSYAHTVCDVCGRTLLRGEHSEVYLNGGTRRSVCELCKTRALQEGWVREGTLPAYDDRDAGSERRRSLLGRLRRQGTGPDSGGSGSPSLDDELSGIYLQPPAADSGAGAGSAAARSGERRARAAREGRDTREVRESREPRHVRAVPTNDDRKVISAADLFNHSEHPRTIAGVARSLGAPVVSIAPAAEHPTTVNIVVSWELCWYRYEVDLSDGVPSVRVDGQGYELEELTEHERIPNASADDVGQLSVA